MENLNNKYLWALNPTGQLALSTLVNQGIDLDLAFELLHITYKNDEIYELEDDTNVSRK